MSIDLEPQSREEMYLSSIDQMGNGTIPSSPQTRKEMYLASINEEMANIGSAVTLKYSSGSIKKEDGTAADFAYINGVISNGGDVVVEESGIKCRISMYNKNAVVFFTGVSPFGSTAVNMIEIMIDAGNNIRYKRANITATVTTS